MCMYFTKDILPIDLPKNFIDMINSYNKQFINHQIQRIDHTLNLIKQRRHSDKPTKQQIHLAVTWCQKYEIPINKNCYYFR